MSNLTVSKLSDLRRDTQYLVLDVYYTDGGYPESGTHPYPYLTVRQFSSKEELEAYMLNSENEARIYRVSPCSITKRIYVEDLSRS
jgi:hypothetical protein